MNNHSKIEAQLAIYADLDVLARQAVDAHVQGCPMCAAQLRDYQELDRSLNLLLASRVQEATQRPVALPRALVVEKPRRSLAWWEALQFRLWRGFQRWQPVIVGAMGLAFFILLVSTQIPRFDEKRPQQPASLPTPAVSAPETVRTGIAKALQIELDIRHSNLRGEEAYIDQTASQAWRFLVEQMFTVTSASDWPNIPVAMTIVESELLRPDLALVRLRIEYSASSFEMGRVYREEDGQWYWTEPPAALWGKPQVYETEHLRFEYRERNAAQVLQMADRLEELYVEWHQRFGVAVDANRDPHDFFVDHKFTFQLALDGMGVQKRSGPIYHVSSPDLMLLRDSDAPLTERYTALLAGILLSDVVEQLQLEPTTGNLLWPMLQSVFMQQLLAERFPFVERLPSHQDEWQVANILARHYPLDLNTLLTLPTDSTEPIVMATALAAFMDATYDKDPAQLLRTLVTMPNAPVPFIEQNFGASLPEFERAWNEWLLVENRALRTVVDAKAAITTSLQLEAQAPATKNSAQIELLTIYVQEQLARVRVQVTQADKELDPQIEGRMYQQGDGRWKRTTPQDFVGVERAVLETRHFRLFYATTDTAMILQAAPALELAYWRLLLLLQLDEQRPANRYQAYWEDNKLNIEIKAEEVDGWSASAAAIPVTAPAFQSWPKEMSDSDALVYTVLTRLFVILLDEVSYNQPLGDWGVFTAGFGQWLLDETAPVSPWRNTIYEEHEVKQFLDQYYPLKIDNLRTLTDARASFVVNRMLMEYIVDTYGKAFVGRYLHALGQYAEWDELIQAVFDVDGTTFEAEWNHYIAAHYAIE